jgi:SAM-dependent methyltransferase
MNMSEKLNIPWKVKSLIYYSIDIFFSSMFLYFCQKYITKRSSKLISSIDNNFIFHKENLIKYKCTNFIFEFGAGKNLAQNIFLSNYIHRQLVVDLNKMIDLDLVNLAKKSLCELMKIKNETYIRDLRDLAKFNIEYMAPYNAEKINLEAKSLDACISTNTLEHIPADSITKIFNELFRVLKDKGIISVVIDYSDHYAHTDSTITLFNYLYFSQTEWKKYNHRCHYQNRLRHYDYKKLFRQCGFMILNEQIKYDQKEIPLDLIIKFSNQEKTWSATSGSFVLVKNSFFY